MPELNPQPVATTGGPTLNVFGNALTLLIPAEQTDGAFALYESVHQPGAGPPRGHTHPFTETFQILEGEYEFILLESTGRRIINARPGDLVHIAPNVPHNFRNSGPTPARAYMTVAPGNIQSFFAEVGKPITTEAPPPGPPDMATLALIFTRYNIAFTTV